MEKWWRLSEIAIPRELEPQNEEIVTLIREALDAYGSGYRRDYVKVVHVEILAKPMYFQQ